MGHTWIKNPELGLPQLLETPTYIGFAIKQMPNHVFTEAYVRATITGSLQCDSGQIHEISRSFRVRLMIPVNVGLRLDQPSTYFRGLPKVALVVAQAAIIAQRVLAKARFVESTIKMLLDSTDAICKGELAPTAEDIEIEERIWLNEHYLPMIVIDPYPPQRAGLDQPKLHRLS